MVLTFLKKLFGGGSPGPGAKGGDGGPRATAGPVAFVDYVVRELVDTPADVRIAVEETDERLAIRITCAKEDMGKVIGRKGRTVSAIRALATGLAGQDSRKVLVDVVD